MDGTREEIGPPECPVCHRDAMDPDCMHGWCDQCQTWREVTSSGHNSGFAGEGLDWWNFECGHGGAEEGPIGPWLW